MRNFFIRLLKSTFYWFSLCYCVTLGRFIEKNHWGDITLDHTWMDYIHITTIKIVSVLAYLINFVIYIITYIPKTLYISLHFTNILAYSFIWLIYLILLLGLIIYLKWIILYRYELWKEKKKKKKEKKE